MSHVEDVPSRGLRAREVQGAAGDVSLRRAPEHRLRRHEARWVEEGEALRAADDGSGLVDGAEPVVVEHDAARIPLGLAAGARPERLPPLRSERVERADDLGRFDRRDREMGLAAGGAARSAAEVVAAPLGDLRGEGVDTVAEASVVVGHPARPARVPC